MVVAGGRRGAQRQRTRERHRPKTSTNGVSTAAALSYTSMKMRQSRLQCEASTVNDAMKQITRDRRGSSPVSKD